ncbi:MAG TPA: hypothetical protein PK509_08185, partial [Catalimonadaceae bacterium]|nr:hypothetical protein [Catalimonadaceae bacterium]
QAELARQDELLFQCVKEHVYAREDVELDAVVSGLISEYKLTVLLHDHLTDGRLRFLLSQHNSVLDFVLLGSDENIPDRFVRISIRKEESESGEETQRINVEFRFSDGEISLSQLDLRPFPVQEVNRNMLSLRALELLRRGILEHHTKLQSE